MVFNCWLCGDRKNIRQSDNPSTAGGVILVKWSESEGEDCPRCVTAPRLKNQIAAKDTEIARLQNEEDEWCEWYASEHVTMGRTNR